MVNVVESNEGLLIEAVDNEGKLLLESFKSKLLGNKCEVSFTGSTCGKIIEISLKSTPEVDVKKEEDIISEVINGAIIHRAQNQNGILGLESIPNIEKIEEGLYKQTFEQAEGSNEELEDIKKRLSVLEKPRVFKNLEPQIVGKKENGDNIYETYVKTDQIENGVIKKEVYAPNIELTNIDIATSSVEVLEKGSVVMSLDYSNGTFSGLSVWPDYRGYGTFAIKKMKFQGEERSGNGFYIAQGDIEESSLVGSQLIVEEYELNGELIVMKDPAVLEIGEIEDKSKQVLLEKELFSEKIGEQTSFLTTGQNWDITHWGQIKSSEDEVFVRFQGKPIEEQV